MWLWILFKAHQRGDLWQAYQNQNRLLYSVKPQRRRQADLKEAAWKSVLTHGKLEVKKKVHDTPEKGCTEVLGQNSETPENSRNYQELQGIAGGCTEMQKRQEWAEVDSNHRRR